VCSAGWDGAGGAHRKDDVVEADVAEKGHAKPPVQKMKSIRDDYEDNEKFDAMERVHEAFIKEEALAWRKRLRGGAKTSANRGMKIKLFSKWLWSCVY